MTFTVTINMDNAVFDDDNQNLSRKLRQVLKRVDNDIPYYVGAGDKGDIFDSNDNRVGEWVIS